nr:peroxidase 64 [Tanacetum cinerariifolium]
MSPFKSLYGRDVTSIHNYLPGSTEMGSIENSLLEHQKIMSSLKHSIEVSKQKMVKQANKHRLDKHFEIGDFVYLGLHKYMQTSVHNRTNQKLSRLFYGPYKVIERIGEVSYKLELIHPIFHVSLLKPSYGTTTDSQGNVAAFDPKDDLAFLPEAIINSRTDSNGDPEVLVKWEKHNLEEATWENLNSLKLQFPNLDYIGDNVKFATCTLLGAALTWWNGYVRTLGHDVAYAMTWENLKKKLTDKYCPKGEIKKLAIELWNLKVKGNDVGGYTQRFQELALMCTKFISNETEKVDKYISGLPDNIHGNVMSARPKTLDDAIELANDLMDQKLSTYAKRQSENKRKLDNNNQAQ